MQQQQQTQQMRLLLPLLLLLLLLRHRPAASLAASVGAARGREVAAGVEVARAASGMPVLLQCVSAGVLVSVTSVTALMVHTLML
jgi:hypothetical protein